MKIMVKKFDNTKVQFDWIELNTEISDIVKVQTDLLNEGNSAISSPLMNHDMVVEVKTIKEFKKQKQSMIEYAKQMRIKHNLV